MGKLDDAYDDEMHGHGAYEDRREYSGAAPPQDAVLIDLVIHAETEKAVRVSGKLWTITRSGDREHGRILREKWVPKVATGGLELAKRGLQSSITVANWLAMKLVAERFDKL